MAVDRATGALRLWGKWLVSDLKASIASALKWRSGTVSDLEDSVRMEVTPDDKNGNISFRLYMNDYWEFVDKGRGATKSGSKPGKVRAAMNGSWMTGKIGINPQSKLQEITQRYYDKQGIKRTAKKQPFDKAVKSLSYIYSRKVHRDGYKPRPFYDKVVNQARIDELKELLGKELAKDLLIQLKD